MFKRFFKIKFLLFSLIFSLLFSCSHLIEEEFFTENCADIKTAQYWENEAIKLKKKITNQKEKYKKSSTKAEKKQNKYTLRETKYLYKLYKRAARENLDHKLHVFREYEKNFIKCEAEYYDNPKLFRKLYR